MKLAFVLGSYSVGSRPLNFNILWQSPRGLTGTELGIVMNAQEMVKLGHDVSLFTVHDGEKPSKWNGIKLFAADQVITVIDETFDAVISYNEPDVFRGMCQKPLKVVSQMLNDFRYCIQGFDELVDVYTSPSQMHMEYVKKLTPNPNKWKVIPLGCDPEAYVENKVPGRVVWTSSADRGLHLLLQEWPKIKKAVPEAHLKMFYNFNFGDLTKYEPNDQILTTGNNMYHPVVVEMGNRIRYCQNAINKLKHLDVEMVGSISRERMQKEMGEAMVLAYPVDTVNFTEGFSVSIMEACASGTLPVISDCDCLGSIYGGVVPMIKSPPKNNMNEFVDLVIRGLTDTKFHKETTGKCKEFARGYSWKNAALKLEKLLKEEFKMNNKEYVDKVNSNEYPNDIKVPLDKPFVDDRGIIQNLWLGQSGSVTLIKSNKGAVRAKHKHTNDFHAAYILNGHVKYVEGEPGTKQVEFLFKTGDMFFTKPGVYHVMEFMEDTDMLTINGICKNHDNYEKDIKRY